jgi:prolyl-tRNA synthetase
MRYTKLFGKSVIRYTGHRKAYAFNLLEKAGYVRSLANGLFSMLPLGQRVARRLISLILEEMEELGGQEVAMPMVNPHELWTSSGRAQLIEREMVSFSDREGRKLVLAPSHEEAMLDLVRKAISSSKDLPVLLYQIQSKFRDEDKPRGGLIRAKEFLMKDAYSFHRSYTELNNFFPKMFAAYMRIFARCGLPVFPAEAGVGYMGGERAYEFLFESPRGEDVIISCNSCGYKANREVAISVKDSQPGNPRGLTEIETPNCDTMKKLASFLDLDLNQLAKPLVYKTLNGYCMAVVRGDYTVSIEKLSRVLGEPVLRMATRTELELFGLVPGYLSPVGIKNLPIVVDETVAESANLVMGANEEGKHLQNVNFGRDFETAYVGDIARVRKNNICKLCGSPLSEVKAMELGHIFKLRDFYSRSMHFTLPDDESKFPEMGSYGIGIGRLMSAITQHWADEKGIVWPLLLAPYPVHLAGIGNMISVRRAVEDLYHLLGPQDVLYDDRRESGGVILKDADLLGMPLRIIASRRTLDKGEVECTDRQSGESEMVPIDLVPRKIAEFTASKMMEQEAFENSILPVVKETIDQEIDF